MLLMKYETMKYEFLKEKSLTVRKMSNKVTGLQEPLLLDGALISGLRPAALCMLTVDDFKKLQCALEIIWTIAKK